MFRMQQQDLPKIYVHEIKWHQHYETYIGCLFGIVSHVNCAYLCTYTYAYRQQPIVFVWSRDGYSEHAVPEPTQICRQQSLHTTQLKISEWCFSPFVFHTPDPKLGMNYLPSFRDWRTTRRSDASWRHFCLNVCLLHSDSLAAVHLGVSDGQYESESEQWT